MADVDILRETRKWRQYVEDRLGGFQGLGIWRYRTATDAFPATGRMQFDDLIIGDATEMYVHETNDGGTDMTAFLDLIVADDLIYVQIQADSSQFVIVQTGTPTKAGSVYTFPVVAIEGQGTPPTNNTQVAIVITKSGGAGGGSPAFSAINVQNGDYEFVLSDAGKTISKESGGAGETYTIPANASVAYVDGSWVAIDNDGGDDLTIEITTDVMEGTDGVTGTRTLGDNERALVQKMSTTKWRYQATDL